MHCIWHWFFLFPICIHSTFYFQLNLLLWDVDSHALVRNSILHPASPMVTFFIITAQYQNKEIGFSASVHSQRHSGFLKLRVEESHYHIFKISYQINQVAGKGPNKEEAWPLSKETVLKASGSISPTQGSEKINLQCVMICLYFINRNGV